MIVITCRCRKQNSGLIGTFYDNLVIVVAEFSARCKDFNFRRKFKPIASPSIREISLNLNFIAIDVIRMNPLVSIKMKRKADGAFLIGRQPHHAHIISK